MDFVNNTKTDHKFQFDGLLPMDVKQDEVFDMIARDAVNSALDGYNSTLFAYGQTGSGKTFTITGGSDQCVVGASCVWVYAFDVCGRCCVTIPA